MLTRTPSAELRIYLKALASTFVAAVFWMGWIGFVCFFASSNWWDEFKFVGPLFLASLTLKLVFLGVVERWPKFFESYCSPAKAGIGFTVFEAILWSLVIFGGSWAQFSTWRPDWGGALFVLFFGAIIVVVLWPVY
ncbi:hypothetical protein IAD21_04135 [Abditibacteriota bacterium]|nr:hypothetical protein IAD21_04135 [Abditibacteriota bacterium]